MIIGSLKDASRYIHIHPLLKKAFDYLNSSDLTKIELGKIELQGSDLFLIVSDSSLRAEHEAKLEVHDEYIDIQLPITITEKMGWSPRNILEIPAGDFDSNKDIRFYEDMPSVIFPVNVGDFVIFFPEDAHAPCIGEGILRKIVIKVKL